MKDLKAVFFVRDFNGNRGYQESQTVEGQRHGRRLEVIFRDGEKLVGTSEAYNPQKLGFFLFPADGKSNNSRIFIVNRNCERLSSSSCVRLRLVHARYHSQKSWHRQTA